MLSIASLSRGPGYYLELANINYYADGGEPPPTWCGTVARELGLSGLAQREHVERLCSGYHHETGRGLVRNAGEESRNPGHDLTFSAPKSVSVAWAMADEALRKAIAIKHEEAVKTALAFVEAKAGYARVGKGGQELVRAPLLFALFEHGTSRAKDPQLHTHALCINLTVHQDGRTTAIDSTHLYHWKMAAGAMYRAALARGLQELGLEIERRRIGSSIGFELKAVPAALVEEFSKRRAEIEAILMLRAGSLDAASPEYAELIAKESRRSKDVEKPRGELIAEWQAVGREFGFDLEEFYARRVPLERPAAEELAERREEIFRDAVGVLSEQLSHWNEAELTKALAERSAGLLTAQQVQELAYEKLQGRELVRLGTLVTDATDGPNTRYIDRTEMRYTTAEILRLERGMLENVERIVGGRDSSVPADRIRRALEGSDRPLDSEQKNAVEWLCSGPSIRLLSGLAGTGKTWTLETCHDLWKREGRRVVGCSVAAAAAERLQEGTGIESGTLDGLLNRLERGKFALTSNDVLVLDEAGMVGTKHMARLIDHLAASDGARLVLVGDAKQLQPILAGGPFKYLAETLGEARLSTIRRQDAQWSRDAVRDFESGRSHEAVAAYVERGCFHLADSRPQAMAQLVEQWAKDGGVKHPESVLMIAGLNSEVKELNLRAQAERIRAGEVDAEKKIYANGVYFHEGDRLQFLKNSRPLGVSNSNMGNVLAVDPDGGRLRVRLDDEREIDVAFNRYRPEHLRLGYASTTHKAQGATFPHVHVLMGGMYSDLHMTYVQASRSKISTHLFCDKATAGPELADLVRAAARERPKTIAHAVGDGGRREVEREPREENRLAVRPEPTLHRHHGPTLSP